MRKDYQEKYTKPKLREEIKEELKKGSKGGKKGKWSARKSQLLVQEYEKMGGGYIEHENNKEAGSLKEWTDQEWQTKEQEGKARQGGIMKRYLPKIDVYKKAKELNIRGRSNMSKEQLKKEVKKEYREQLSSQSKKELYDKARSLDIKNRSNLDKKALKRKILEAEVG